MSFGGGSVGGGIATADDVVLSGLVNAQVLVFNSGSAKWVNDSAQTGPKGDTGSAGAGVIFISDGSAVPPGTPPGLVVRPEVP